MSVQLQYVQLIADNTDSNTVNLSSGVFTILISVTQTKKYKVYCQTSLKKLANRDLTKKTLSRTALPLCSSCAS